MGKTKNRQTTTSLFDSEWAGREFGKYRAEKLLSKHESRQTVTLLATNKQTNERVALKAFGLFSENPERVQERNSGIQKA